MHAFSRELILLILGCTKSHTMVLKILSDSKELTQKRYTILGDKYGVIGNSKSAFSE